MKYKKIAELIKKKLKLYKIFIEGIEKNIKIIAIGDIFIGLNSVKKQQLIYAPLMSYFKKNTIHAINIDTYSISEWNKKRNNKLK